MKQYFKNYLKLGILLFGIPLLLFNCQNEELENSSFPTNKERQINFLSEKELPPSILNFLDSKTSGRLSKNYASRTEESGTTIDMDNIMQVIDTIGNINYTFRVNVNDENDTTFFNLIVNEDTESANNISYILKYQIDQSYLQYWIDNNYDFAYFTGKVYRYNLTDFFNLYSFASRTVSENLTSGVDDCPCNIDDIDDGTSGNPGGSGSGGGLTITIVCNTSYTTAEMDCCNEGYCFSHWPTPGDYNGDCSGTYINVATTECHTVFTTSNRTTNRDEDDDCLNPCDDEPTDGEVGVLLPKKSPCDRMIELGNDDAFKGYLSAMKTFATSTDPNDNREVAYTRTDDGNYSDVFVGELGADNVEVAVSNPINIHMHSHQLKVLSRKSLSIFSADDLYAIYKLLDTDKITNYTILR